MTLFSVYVPVEIGSALLLTAVGPLSFLNALIHHLALLCVLHSVTVIELSGQFFLVFIYIWKFRMITRYIPYIHTHIINGNC